MIRLLLVLIPPVALRFKGSFFFVPAFRASLGTAESPDAGALLFLHRKNKGTATLDTGNDQIFHIDTSELRWVLVIKLKGGPGFIIPF